MTARFEPDLNNSLSQSAGPLQEEAEGEEGGEGEGEVDGGQQHHHHQHHPHQLVETKCDNEKVKR